MSAGKRTAGEKDMTRKLIQYPIDLCDRETWLKGVLKIRRQLLYITIRDRDWPRFYMRHILNKRVKQINEIVRELYI